MLMWNTLKVALKSLMANKMRTLLSMLGIIIGVGAVIAMLALGTGAEKKVLDDISAMGANLIMVMPGQHMRSGVHVGSRETLKLDDAKAILDEVPNVTSVSPMVRTSGQFKYYNKNIQSNISGVAQTYFAIRNFQLEKGRIFTENEVAQRARVAVIGADTWEQLFVTDNPIGEEIKINGISFKVIGLLKKKGSQGPFSFDDIALAPFTTVMNRVLGQDYLREVDIQIKQGADQAQVQKDIEKLLRKRHKIKPDALDDFQVRNMAEMAEMATSLSQTFKILLGSVAGISLIVGGIGIMNIMLVTVTERTREIGIRKAIGARNQDVLVQFLLEAILLSSLGGIIGVAVGIGVAQTITTLSNFTAIVSVSSVLIAFGFATGVGVFFGFYPARRASLLDPIEALSYE